MYGDKHTLFHREGHIAVNTSTPCTQDTKLYFIYFIISVVCIRFCVQHIKSMQIWNKANKLQKRLRLPYGMQYTGYLFHGILRDTGNVGT